MTLFTNPNFIDHIVKSQGADEAIPQEHYTSLQTLIELETRLLLENALKFMHRDRRDTLSLQDIENAAK
jgi:histone H3/H4